MYKALGFDKETTLNVALKTFMIFPGYIAQGGRAVLQNQENKFLSPRIIYPQRGSLDIDSGNSAASASW